MTNLGPSDCVDDYAPFVLGASFRVIPPGLRSRDEASSDQERVELIMTRGAFGSGEHETTQSCLELLASLPDLRASRVLDLGSGTGILAIAALKRGASRATCVDNEPTAIETCRANCALNGVDGQVTHLCGMLQDLNAKDFDLILANIYADVLLDVAEDLTAKARPGAAALLSGIAIEYNYDVQRRYELLGWRRVGGRMLESFQTLSMRLEP